MTFKSPGSAATPAALLTLIILAFGAVAATAAPVAPARTDTTAAQAGAPGSASPAPATASPAPSAPAAASPAPSSPAAPARLDSAAVAPASPAVAAPGASLVDRIVAIVDTEAILQSDLDREVALYRLEQDQSSQPDKRSDAEIRHDVLERLIESKLMIAAAKEADIKIEDATVKQDVDDNIQELIKHFGSQAALESELSRNGMTLADYRARSTAQLRDRHYMSAVVNRFVRPKVEVLENEIEDYYKAHEKEIPATADSVTLGSILVPITPSTESRQAAEKKLGTALQALGKGESFADVARKYSEAPEGARGGSIGIVHPGDLADAGLERAVFALTVGQTSQPIVSEQGIHVLHLDAVTEQGRSVSQIFVSQRITAEDVQGAKRQADAAHARLTSGEPFAKVAAEVSADAKTADKGGDLGTFPLTDLSPKFQEALAGKEAGDLTEPFQTPAGFYIFLVKRRVHGRPRTYAEVKDTLRRAIENDKLEAELSKYVAGLRDRFYIDIKG